MPAVAFTEPDGSRRVVDVPVGTSLMLAARLNDVSGILGECGGSAACATCHVYVSEAALSRLPPIEELEEQMLQATAAERRNNSRLACQIVMTADLEGLEVTIPPVQN